MCRLFNGELISIRASGAGSKRNVVSIATKRSVRLQPPAGRLSSVAVDAWKIHVKILAERGVLDHEHQLMLILYSNAWHYLVEAGAYLVEAGAYLAENAKTTKVSRGLASEGGSGGAKKNHVFTARNIALNQLVRAGSMLRLDPLSSLRSGSVSKSDKYNEFGEF